MTLQSKSSQWNDYESLTTTNVMSESNSQKALLAAVDIGLPTLYPGGMKIPHLDTDLPHGYKVLISTCSILDNCLQSKSVGSEGRLTNRSCGVKRFLHI